MDPDLPHHPAVALFLLFVVVGGALMAIINLRNASLWLLQIRGVRAEGVVESMEMAADRSYEQLCRPVVAFTTAQGERVVGKPSLYRKSTSLTKGEIVPVRYAAHNPARMVVPGFGFRYREPIYACVGAATAIAISVLYFGV